MKTLLLLSCLFVFACGQTLVTCPLGSCSSNVVSVRTSLLNPKTAVCRYVGDVVTLNLQVNMTDIDSLRRYDAQIYVGTDSQGGTLTSGNCVRYILTPLSTTPTVRQLTSGTGPYLDAGGSPSNACGDLPAAGALVVANYISANVKCADVNSDGLLDPVTTCVSYVEVQGGDHCNTTKSSPCSCSSTQLGIVVPADPNGCLVNPCGAGYLCADEAGSDPTARFCTCPTGTVNNGTACQVFVSITTDGILATEVSSSPVVFNVALGRSISGTFTKSKITVVGPATNASPTFVVAQVDSTHYTITVSSGSSNGKYTVTMALGAGVINVGGVNFFTEVATKTVNLDTSDPSLAVSATNNIYTNDPNMIVFHFKFSKPVYFNIDNELTPAEITALLGSLTNAQAVFVTYDWLSPSTAFDIHVIPIAEGAISMSFPAGVVFDDADLPNQAGVPSPFTIYWDITPPSVVLTTAYTRTNSNPVVITATFSESVVPPIADPLLSAAKASILAASSGISSVISIMMDTTTATPSTVFYITVAIPPASDGSFINVIVPAGITTDLAKNQNLASQGLTIFYGSNLCSTSNGGCSSQATCTNQPTVGNRVCTCNTGYTGTGDVCTDINECATNNGACAVNAFCTNTPGSRTCECPLGLDGDGYAFCNVSICGRGFFFNTTSGECQDVNECSQRNGGCLAGTTCTNGNGTYTCGPCPTGTYTGSNTPQDPCVDVNECMTNGGGCDTLAACINQPGSYECCCNQGYIGSGLPGTCAACDTGFTGTCQGPCVDINECATTNGGCQQVCTNTSPFRVCGCNTGYLQDANDATKCDDINECATNAGGCNPLVSCINLAGSRTCTNCPPGYQGSGVGPDGCQDINECQVGGSQCVDATDGGVCTNTVPGANCSCAPGYTGDGYASLYGGTGCTTINYCATQNGGCDVRATCLAAHGSRTCTCNTNYVGDGVTCVEINLCATSNGGCNVNAKCSVPGLGQKSCACNSGFVGDGVNTCNDINECATSNGGCVSVISTCVNTPGSRLCQCPTGYEDSTGNGNCVDINECQVENGQCDINFGNCTNTPGSRLCGCNAGYFGNGIHCTDYTRPSVLVTAIRAATNQQPVQFYVQFNKTVQSFTNANGAQLTITNGVFDSVVEQNYPIESSLFVVNVNASGDGSTPTDVTLQMPEAVVVDWGNHPNLLSNIATSRYVTVFPAPVVTAAAATNQPPVIHIDFGQTATGFSDQNQDVVTKIEDAGSNIASIQIVSLPSTQSLPVTTPPRKFHNLASAPGSLYNIIVTPAALGPVTFTFPAGVATDAAGNTNQASTVQLSVLYDNTPLLINVSAVNAFTHTNAVFLLTFNKTPVFGFDNTNISPTTLLSWLTNANSASIQQLSGSQFTITATPIVSGTYVVLTVPGNVAKDVAGNFNLPATGSVSILYDTSPLLIQSVHAQYDKVPTIAVFIVTFNKPAIFDGAAGINGFDTMKGATVNALAVSTEELQDGTYRTAWTVLVNPVDFSANVTLVVPESVAQDQAGNDNLGPVTADGSVSFVLGAPTVKLTPRVAYTNQRTVYADITSDISCSVRDPLVLKTAVQNQIPIATDVQIAADTGGTAGSSTHWILTITVSSNVAQGLMTFYIPQLTFLIGVEPNAQSNTITIHFDTVAPTVTISVTDKSKSPLFTLNFTELVMFPTIAQTQLATLVTGAFDIVSSPRSGSSPDSVYDLRVTVNSPSTTQWLNMTLPAGVATDLAGNPNAAVPTYSYNYADSTKSSEIVFAVNSSSDQKKVWIPVGIILGLIVIFCICCIVYWWYNKNKGERVKNTSDDEEAVRVKEATTTDGAGAGAGQTGGENAEPNEAKRNEYDEVGVTGGTGDSDDEDSLAKAKRLGAGSGDAPVYHIHYQEDSQNQSEDGAADENTGLVQSSGRAPDSPVDSAENGSSSAGGGGDAPAKNSGALVWL